MEAKRESPVPPGGSDLQIMHVPDWVHFLLLAQTAGAQLEKPMFLSASLLSYTETTVPYPRFLRLVGR